MIRPFYILFVAMFVLVACFIGYTIMRNVKRERSNDRSPKLTVKAKVVSKRTHFRNGNDHGYTYYYVTFQVESGDRMELQMQGNEFGLLVEGDQGNLTFQGTRFLQFDRVAPSYDVS